MIFGKNQNFFLTLEPEAPEVELAMDEATTPETESQSASAPEMSLTVAVAEPEVSETAEQAEACVIQSPSDQTAEQVSQTPQTTAEAIATELADFEAARPKIIFSTYAPDQLTAGSGLPTRRRRPGASMKMFRGLAIDLFRN
jgi:hypothetical protein